MLMSESSSRMSIDARLRLLAVNCLSFTCDKNRRGRTFYVLKDATVRPCVFFRTNEGDR